MIELQDIVEIPDLRTEKPNARYTEFLPLRNFKGNYGVPRRVGEKVIKGLFETDIPTLKNLLNLHEQYVKELQRFFPVTKTKPNIKDQTFFLVQPYREGKTFENLLKNTSSDSIEESYTEILEKTLFCLKNSDKIIGIDGKPENWILNDNSEWEYLDTFPPFLIEREELFSKIFNLRRFEIEFSSNPDKTYFRNLRKVARRFWLKSSKISNINFRDLTIEILSKYDKNAKSTFQKIKGN